MKISSTALMAMLALLPAALAAPAVAAEQGLNVRSPYPPLLNSGTDSFLESPSNHAVSKSATAANMEITAVVGISPANPRFISLGSLALVGIETRTKNDVV